LFDGVEKILVVKLRHIGDVLLSVPAIRALKETFPNAGVSALVNSGTEEMLTLNPLVEEVVCYEREIKRAPIERRIPAELRFAAGVRKRGFDMTVDLTGGDRAALLGFLSGARYRLGYRPGAGFAGKRYLYTHMAEPPGARTHTVMRDLGLVSAFGIETQDLGVDIFYSDEDASFVAGLLDGAGLGGAAFVHVHPSSRWGFKCWGDAHMARVMDFFVDRGLAVVLTTGPESGEVERGRAIIGLAGSAPLDLSGRLSLKQLAALSARSALFFGPDSAPMHIAAAVGTRAIGLFGPSGAFDWGPWENAAASAWRPASDGPVSPYPARGGVQRFGSNIVIQKDWECVPCGRDGCDGSKKSRCLDELSAEEVIEALCPVVEEVTGRGARGPGRGLG